MGMEGLEMAGEQRTRLRPVMPDMSKSCTALNVALCVPEIRVGSERLTNRQPVTSLVPPERQ
jgi:hypothetical protein